MEPHLACQEHNMMALKSLAHRNAVMNFVDIAAVTFHQSHYTSTCHRTVATEHKIDERMHVGCLLTKFT